MRRIAVHPNCSMTRREALIFFSGIAAVSLAIAGTFTAMGFWPILPFAGLELALLAAAIHWNMRRGECREVISITPDRVCIERGRHGPAERVEFPRHWAWVDLRRSRIASYPSRLLICAHGRRFEIGEFLNEQERLSLNRRLRSLIGDSNRTPDLGGPAES